MTDVGDTSGHSPDFVLTVDTTVAPVSDLQVTDNVGEEQGVVSNGGITDDTTPTLSGTAEPGSTVTIFDKGIQIGTALVAENGNWSFLQPQRYLKASIPSQQLSLMKLVIQVIHLLPLLSLLN